MRRGLALIAAALVILVLARPAAGTARMYGRVVNRDGVAQVQCQVDFNQNGRVRYKAYTDRGGSFFVDNPEDGRYDVLVVRGPRSASFRVSIRGRLEPSTLVVPW